MSLQGRTCGVPWQTPPRRAGPCDEDANRSQALPSNNSRPISIRRISLVPAPIA